MMRTRDTSSKIEQHRGTWIAIAMLPNLAKKAGDTSTAGTNRICSNGGSKKNECGYGTF